MRAVEVVEEAVADGWREIRGVAAFGDGTRIPLFLRFPDAGPHPAPGDFFLPTLLVPAMILGEELRIEAPVTRSLLAAARERVAPVIEGFHPGRVSIVDVSAAEELDDTGVERLPGVASCFSHGLDSRWTLHTWRERLTHLVYLHGFDMGHDAHPVMDELGRRAREIAHAEGLGLLELHCNARRQLNREMQRRINAFPGPRSHYSEEFQLGSSLVAFAQGLVGHVGHIVIPASFPLAHGTGRGSHPWIEDNWSSARLRAESPDGFVGRIERVRDLARERPDLLRGVRACWARPPRVGNCGRCGKCVRLRFELALAGVAPGEGPFDDPIDHAYVRRSHFRMDPGHWQEIRDEALEHGDAELIRTVEVLMGQRRHVPRELARTGHRLARRIRRWRGARA